MIPFQKNTIVLFKTESDSFLKDKIFPEEGKMLIANLDSNLDIEDCGHFYVFDLRNSKNLNSHIGRQIDDWLVPPLIESENIVNIISQGHPIHITNFNFSFIFALLFVQLISF